MQKFDTPAPVSAVIDVAAGNIRIAAADDHAATAVEVLPANASKSRDVKAAEEATVEYGADGVLRINAAPAKNQILGASGTVEVVIQLPAGSDIVAKAASGEIRSVGRLGDVAFEGAHGSVKLDEVAGARLTLQAGDVSVVRLVGSAEISTQKGDLQITEAVQGKVTLRTESGEISVGAARGVSAFLDAGTTYGRIHNTLQNTDGASARLSIHASTAYGDITARSL